MKITFKGKVSFNREITHDRQLGDLPSAIGGDKGDLIEFSIDTDGDFSGVLSTTLLFITSDEVTEAIEEILLYHDENCGKLISSIESLEHQFEPIGDFCIQLDSEEETMEFQDLFFAMGGRWFDKTKDYKYLDKRVFSVYPNKIGKTGFKNRCITYGENTDTAYKSGLPIYKLLQLKAILHLQ